jgi:tetrahydromethanopterin S-methyltransferase subunit B
MAEEGRVLEDRIENRLDGIENRLSRLDGTVEQMDRWLSNVEQLLRQMQGSIETGNRWVIGLILGTWVTLMLALISFALNILSRLPG